VVDFLEEELVGIVDKVLKDGGEHLWVIVAHVDSSAAGMDAHIWLASWVSWCELLDGSWSGAHDADDEAAHVVHPVTLPK
jgi:hypothetical protein